MKKFLVLYLIFINLFSSNAQCPIGETEITIEFTEETPNPFGSGELIKWSYLINGTAAGNEPYNENDILTICVPPGNLEVLACSSSFIDQDFPPDYYTASGLEFVNLSITITEDGSVNGCGEQNNCIFNLPGIQQTNLCFSSDYPRRTVAQIEVGSCNNSISGCTNPLAPNYNSCAANDDGSCMIISENDNCSNAIPIGVEPYKSCSGNFITVTNTSNTPEYSPSCANQVVDLFYTFIVPPSGNIKLSTEIFDGSRVGFTILDMCNNIELFCSQNESDNVYNLPEGEELTLQLWQSTPGYFDICIEEIPDFPINDSCINSTSICVGTSGSNIGATSDDILVPGTSEFLENAVWFSFEAESYEPVFIDIELGDCIPPNSTESALQFYLLEGYNCSELNDVNLYLDYTFSDNIYSLGYYQPFPNITTYLVVYGDECDFEVISTQQMKPCCEPIFTFTPSCSLGDQQNFTVDIEVIDINNNANNYRINGINYSNLAQGDIIKVGPFPNGTTPIRIEGLDGLDCVTTKNIAFDCDNNCSQYSFLVPDDTLIVLGDTFEATVSMLDKVGDFTGTYQVTSSTMESTCTVIPTNTVTEVDFSNNQEFSEPIPLGFDFNFWENTYSELNIGANGYVTFGGIPDTLLNLSYEIPSFVKPNNYIALFFGDLTFRSDNYSSGKVSYFNELINGKACLVVEFSEVHFQGSYNNTITGQIIMCEDGGITINCINCEIDDTRYDGSYTGNYDPYPLSGIENEEGTVGYFDENLSGGRYLGVLPYMSCTTFTPDTLKASACNFLYWVTDLNNPTGTIVSTEETAIFSPSVTTTYYAVVECEDDVQCIEDVIVTVCDEDLSCFGCIDVGACNYDPNANTDDGSCVYPETNLDCYGNCAVELDCAGECGGTTTVGSDCDDGDSDTINDKYNSNCICRGTPTFSGIILLSCANTDGLDCNKDLVLVSLFLTDWVSPLTVTNSTGNFYNSSCDLSNNNDLSNFIETDPVFPGAAILEFWIIADGQSTYSITIQDGSDYSITLEDGACGPFGDNAGSFSCE